MPFALCLAGCRHLTPEQRIATAASIVQQATTAGVAYDVRSNPGHRAYFLAAQQAINLAIHDQKFSPDDLRRAVESLQIAELQGPGGVLVLTGLVGVLDVTSATLFDVQSEPAVAAILAALRDGITAGLAERQRSAVSLGAPHPNARVPSKTATLKHVRI